MPAAYFLYGLNLALASPTIYTNEGFLFFYPLYTPTWAQNLHSFGSFYYTYNMTWYVKTCSNSKFNDRVYDIFVGGSMYAYIMHYLWIVTVVNMVVLPYKLDFTAGVFITFAGTELCILFFHFFIEFVESKVKSSKK
jgi:hypothetical protein